MRQPRCRRHVAGLLLFMGRGTAPVVWATESAAEAQQLPDLLAPPEGASNSSSSCRLPVHCGYADGAPRLIATVAGLLGVGGRSGDGGIATMGQLQSPTGIAVDPASRRLYLADTGNHAVRTVDLEASLLATSAGVLGSYGRTGRGLPGVLPELRSPRAVAVVPAQELLYIADTDNHVIRTLHLRTGRLSIAAGVFAAAGRRGDGGTATAAQLNAPRGVAVDEAAGLLFVADTHNHAVRVADLAAGSLSTLAGVLGSGGLAGDGGAAAQSLLHFPYAVLFDAGGRQLFVTEPYNHAVRAIDLAATGDAGPTLSTVAGVLGVPGFAGDGSAATAAHLNFPYGIDLDTSARQLYIADANNHVIRLVDLETGVIYTVAGVPGSPGRAGRRGPALAAQLNYPTGVAVDAAGRKLYVADRSNHAARAVDLAARALVTLAGRLGGPGFADGAAPAGARLHSPRAVAVDRHADELYVADASNHAVRKVSLGGAAVSTVVGHARLSPEISLSLDFPCGVALDNSGPTRRLYVADAGAHVVYAADLTHGTIVPVAGTVAPSGPGVLTPSADASTLNGPYGLAIDETGEHLYIADAGNHAVRLLTISSGDLATVAGVPGSPGRAGDGDLASSAQLHLPCGLALGTVLPGSIRAKRLYIADTQNHAIRALDLQAQTLSTVAGVLGSGGTDGDGNQATMAQLYFPYSVAVDTAAQQLYIADNWNHAIRHVNLATGLLTTLAGVLGSYGLSGAQGLATKAQLHFPMGITLDDQARRLYVADAGNHVVRLVALSDEVRVNFSRFSLV